MEENEILVENEEAVRKKETQKERDSMIHPSYSELMQEVNKEVEVNEAPVVNSRYSIVLATSKRARQLIAGAESFVGSIDGRKPLSVAVEEVYKGKVKILPEELESEAFVELEEE